MSQTDGLKALDICFSFYHTIVWHFGEKTFSATYHSGRWTENNKKKFGWTQSDNTKTTIPRYNSMFFYVFKMAVAVVFLCENAVEAI